MRSLLVVMSLASIAAPAAPAAAAPDDRVVATPATVGAITGTPVARAIVGHGAQVIVLDSKGGNADGDDDDNLRVELNYGNTWWTAVDGIWMMSDCGMGKCITPTLDGVTIKDQGNVVWLRFELTYTRTHSDPEMKSQDSEAHVTEVVGCTVPRDGVAPRCALVAPNHFGSSVTTIQDTTVTFRGEGDSGSVVVAF